MKLIALEFILTTLILGCATTPLAAPINNVNTISPPHTAEDITRRFKKSFEIVIEACLFAIEYIGADYLKPEININDNNASITAATETCLYGVILMGDDEHTDVILILDDKSTKEVIRKSVFDNFWNAMEAYLN